MLTVSGARTDLDDDIGGLEEGLVDNGIADSGVLEDVLAKVLVEAEDVCVGGASLGSIGAALGRFAVVGSGGVGTARPLLLGSLGHGVGRCGCPTGGSKCGLPGGCLVLVCSLVDWLYRLQNTSVTKTPQNGGSPHRPPVFFGRAEKGTPPKNPDKIEHEIRWSHTACQAGRATDFQVLTPGPGRCRWCRWCRGGPGQCLAGGCWSCLAGLT